MLSCKDQSMISCTAFGNRDVKKFILLLIFLVLFFFSASNSAVIKVGIQKSLDGDIISFSYDSSKDIIKFQFEFYNTGSTPFKARARVDVINNSKTAFTGWSEEKILMPGDRKNFEVYWYTNSTGNFILRLRVYFGNEIMEKFFIVEKNNSLFSEDVFEIKNFRTYDDLIVFDIKASKNVKNVVILPFDYPLGWIFEQKKIDFLNEGEEKTVAIKYYPNVWFEDKVTLIVASDSGKFKTEKNFEMKKESGILWLIHYVADKIKLFIRGA